MSSSVSSPPPPPLASSQSQPRTSTSTSTPHLLALKVLRAARPSFAHTPFHPPLNLLLDLPPSTSLQSTASTSNSTLTLPNSFGVIYLGQTFHGLLSVQHDGRETTTTAQNAMLQVEIHTAATKSRLAQVGPAQINQGSPGLELSVKHEIKELGKVLLVNQPRPLESILK